MGQMHEIIRQALYNCRSVYNMIHGPEVWLMIAQIAIELAIFNAGILVGMYIAALMRANGREDDERH